MERANRTFREDLEDVDLENRFQAEDALKSIIDHYNTERLHSALGFLRPADYYRGDPPQLHECRRRKLAQARHRRKQINLQSRQRTLPLETNETVSCNCPRNVSLPLKQITKVREDLEEIMPVIVVNHGPRKE